MFEFVSDPNPCTNFSLRLSGGPNDLVGLLEMCYKGHWGTICSDGTFNATAASVACRKLGHTGVGATVLTGTSYGQGNGIIWLSHVECSGKETGLHECSHLPWGTLSPTCYGHSQDVTLQCQSIVACY